MMCELVIIFIITSGAKVAKVATRAKKKFLFQRPFCGASHKNTEFLKKEILSDIDFNSPVFVMGNKKPPKRRSES